MGVVVVGDALIDELHGDGSEPVRHVGGAALNVAVGLAVLGLRTRLVAMVGEDEDGAWIGRYLAGHGVELVATPAEHGTARAVSRRVAGEPSYEFNLSARRRRIAVDATVGPVLSAASHVVVSCFPFDDPDQTSALLGAVADRAHRLIVDPNPRAGMMNDLGTFRQSVAEVARSCRLVKIGGDDAQMLYGTSVDEAARMLLGLGAGAVLTTSGADGAAVHTAGGLRWDAPVVGLDGPIVDTMGAGDATVAVLTRAIVAADAVGIEVSWREALDRAMLVAAATCRAPGALLRLP